MQLMVQQYKSDTQLQTHMMHYTVQQYCKVLSKQKSIRLGKETLCVNKVYDNQKYEFIKYKNAYSTQKQKIIHCVCVRARVIEFPNVTLQQKNEHFVYVVCHSGCVSVPADNKISNNITSVNHNSFIILLSDIQKSIILSLCQNVSLL